MPPARYAIDADSALQNKQVDALVRDVRELYWDTDKSEFTL